MLRAVVSSERKRMEVRSAPFFARERAHLFPIAGFGREVCHEYGSQEFSKQAAERSKDSAADMEFDSAANRKG